MAVGHAGLGRALRVRTSCRPCAWATHRRRAVSDLDDVEPGGVGVKRRPLLAGPVLRQARGHRAGRARGAAARLDRGGGRQDADRGDRGAAGRARHAARPILVDLTGSVGGDGLVHWSVPPGRWLLFAFWRRPSGQLPNSLYGLSLDANLDALAPDTSTGRLLTVDPFSADATRAALTGWTPTRCRPRRSSCCGPGAVSSTRTRSSTTTAPTARRGPCASWTSSGRGAATPSRAICRRCSSPT